MKTLRFFSILFLFTIPFFQSASAQMMNADQTKKTFKEAFKVLNGKVSWLKGTTDMPMAMSMKK
jgi:hypothetical protein